MTKILPSGPNPVNLLGTATEPRTGKLLEVSRALPDCKRAREAYTILETELARIREGPPRLDKAFKSIAKILEHGYDVSPRAMRRSFQDLARAAQVKDVVTRAISGHATESMQRRYSTVAGAEVREGIAKVIDMATGRERRAS